MSPRASTRCRRSLYLIPCKALDCRRVLEDCRNFVANAFLFEFISNRCVPVRASSLRATECEMMMPSFQSNNEKVIRQDVMRE